MAEYNTYEIENEKGMKAVLTDIGAAVVSLFVKDNTGKFIDVVLGYDDLEKYKEEWCYFGAIVGRNCNRISDAKIKLGEKEYILEGNDRGNNLHSGSKSTSKLVWSVKSHSKEAITFNIISKDKEQGFPGTASISVTYEISPYNELIISYEGIADKTTVFNMTSHCYFNLNGHDSGDVLDQELQINANNITPVKDDKAIPTGELSPVENTPFDFRTSKKIGRDIEADYDQLKYGNGYDHNFAINKTVIGIEKVAKAYSSKSGITMDVLSDCPGLQLYTANFIKGQIGKKGAAYDNRGAFCLETQYFPNAINEENFKSPIVRVGDLYQSRTIYRFSVN